MSKRSEQLHLLKEILWRPGVVTILALYGLLQLISNFISWLLPVEEQPKYQFIRLATWRVWMVATPILTLMMLGLIVRSVLRVIAERDAAYANEKSKLESDIQVKDAQLEQERKAAEERLTAETSELKEAVEYLEERLTPKVEILFNDKPPYIEFQHLNISRPGRNSEILYFRIWRIGVRNIGDSNVYELQAVLSCRCEHKSLENIPLRTRHNPTPPFRQHFSLSSSPDNIEYINVVMRREPDQRRANDRPVLICHAYNYESVDNRLCQGEARHEITITVFGHDSEPRSRGFLVYINEHDLLQMEPIDNQSLQNVGSVPSS